MKMSDEVLNKRMTGLILVAGLMTVGLFFGPMAGFPIYAGTLGTMYSVYALGQSYTDAKENQSGGSR